jgi:hypothetical protein
MKCDAEEGSFHQQSRPETGLILMPQDCQWFQLKQGAAFARAPRPSNQMRGGGRNETPQMPPFFWQSVLKRQRPTVMETSAKVL